MSALTLDIRLKNLHTQNRMRFPARIKLFFLASLLLVTCYLLLAALPVSAQAPNPYAPPNVPNNLHNWTQNVMIEVMAAMSCQLAGIDPTNPQQPCLGIDQQTGNIGFVPSANSGQGGGAIGVTTQLMSTLFTPPLHSGDYFRYLADNFGFVKKTYAQGTGFTSLSPLMGLWSTFRNIVYLGFVVAFVFIGLAIMLRVKIDPRTVMTIENQIPKIIIGLILVTFSFAIAGFLIDLMWVMIYLVFNIISGSAPLMKLDPNVFKDLNPANLQGKNPVDGMGGLISISGMSKDLALSFREIIASSLNLKTDFGAVFNPLSFIGNIGQFVTGSGDFSIVDTMVNLISLFSAFAFGSHINDLSDTGTWLGVKIPTGPVAGWIAAGVMYPLMQTILRWGLPFLIVFIFMLIAIFFALVRLGFELLKAYVFILIDVVMAPFWIVFGLIPGSPVGFGAWLKDILANLSAFPVTIGMLLLGKVFMEAFNQPGTAKEIFVPPLVGNPSGAQFSPLGSLIGLAILLLTPQVVNMMKEALKAPQFKFGASIGQGAMIAPMMGKDIAHNVFSPYGGLVSMKRAGSAFGFLKKGDWSGALNAAVGGGGVAPYPSQGGGGGQQS